MASKRIPGLRKRGRYWHIDKAIKGYGQLNESTRETDYEKAEEYYAKRVEEIRRAVVFGEAPKKQFREAAEKYLLSHSHLRTIERAAIALDHLLPEIGDLYLAEIDNEALEPYIAKRLAAGKMPGTINKELSYVRRILNLASRVWRINGQPWLQTAPPLIESVDGDKRRSYPLTPSEQAKFFRELPAHLAEIALFGVNTGLREHVLCNLLWEWEVEVPELDTSIFLVPGHMNEKNNDEEYILVLNSIAKRILEARRGTDDDYVFTFRGEPMQRINNSAWKKAWRRAKLPVEALIRRGPHNLRHTFGARLRAAGVRLEDRQTLLWHKSDSITTHYSAPDVARLLEFVERITDTKQGNILRVVPAKSRQLSRQKAVTDNTAATN